MSRSDLRSKSVYRVRISDAALNQIVVSGVEAYCLRGVKSSRTGVEILGYLWGTQRRSGEATLIHIDLATTSVVAKGTNTAVRAHKDSAVLMADVLDRWAPHLNLVGDFHTHPFCDLDEVNGVGGFQFSDEDRAAFLEDDDIWGAALESGQHPIMLVLTICRMKRVRDTYGAMVRNQISQFDLGHLRFWLNGAVGYIDRKKRRLTEEKRSPVYLDLNSRFFNMAGDRLKVDGDKLLPS